MIGAPYRTISELCILNIYHILHFDLVADKVGDKQKPLVPWVSGNIHLFCFCILFKLDTMIFRTSWEYSYRSCKEPNQYQKSKIQSLKASVYKCNFDLQWGVITEMKSLRLHTISWFARLVRIAWNSGNCWFRSCLWEKNGNYRRMYKLERINIFHLMICCCKKIFGTEREEVRCPEGCNFLCIFACLLDNISWWEAVGIKGKCISEVCWVSRELFCETLWQLLEGFRPRLIRIMKWCQSMLEIPVHVIPGRGF